MAIHVMYLRATGVSFAFTNRIHLSGKGRTLLSCSSSASRIMVTEQGPGYGIQHWWAELGKTLILRCQGHSLRSRMRLHTGQRTSGACSAGHNEGALRSESNRIFVKPTSLKPPILHTSALRSVTKLMNWSRTRAARSIRLRWQG